MGFIGGGKREVLYTHALRKSVCVVRVCVSRATQRREGRNGGAFLVPYIEKEKKLFHLFHIKDRASKRMREREERERQETMEVWMHGCCVFYVQGCVFVCVTGEAGYGSCLACVCVCV